MDEKRDKNYVDILHSFSLAEIELSVLDPPDLKLPNTVHEPKALNIPEEKMRLLRRNYMRAYNSLAHDVRKAVCRLEDNLESIKLVEVLAVLDDALDRSEQLLLQTE